MPWKPTTSGSLWVECFYILLDILSELCISSCCISFPSSFQVSGRTYHKSIQTDSIGTLLDGGFLVSHSSPHVWGHFLSVSHYKRPCQGYFGRQGALGSAVAAFNPLATQRCVLHRKGFSSSMCQVMAGVTWASTTKVYQQCWKE